MKIQLCLNTSENNTVGKVYTTLATVDCVVKNDCSMSNPTFILQYDGSNLTKVNYIYVADWGRYYYTREREILTGSRYELDGVIDPLESFKTDIKRLNVILDHTQATGKNNYLPSNVWVRNIKNKTNVLTFPSGLLENGEFILITAGG